MINTYHFHFVGIGGISMSAIALYLKQNSISVSGSDQNLNQKTVEKLNQCNTDLFKEEDPCCIDFLNKKNKVALVVTNTVKYNNPLILWAKDLNIKIFTRSFILGEILKKYQVIAVSGSHGKTTTSSMIASIFLEAYKNPSVFIGGFMPCLNGINLKVGANVAIVEADDAYKSFLMLFPDISVVTNISYEHLETYKNYSDIYQTFKQYAEQTKKTGYLIINYDDENMRDWSKSLTTAFKTYGLSKDYDFGAENIYFDVEYNCSAYDLFIDGQIRDRIKVSGIGNHIVKNSLAAYSSCLLSNMISHEEIKHGLINFKTTERRLEFCGFFKEALVYDDYGHHPIEIKAVLETLKLMCKGDLYIFFQPHKYSRTFHLWNDFLDVLSSYNFYKKLFIIDVFDAGDEIIEGFTSKDMVSALSKDNIQYVSYQPDFQDLKMELNNIDIKKNDIILTLGAGYLNLFAKNIVNKK